jgi:hypothetical protein
MCPLSLFELVVPLTVLEVWPTVVCPMEEEVVAEVTMGVVCVVAIV